MGQKSKTSKGEISITNFQGRIRLRWRYAGERYSLNLPYAYLPENLHHGTVKATEIKLDIIKDCFDPTLEKYKPENIVKPTAFKQVEMQAAVEKSQSPTLLHELDQPGFRILAHRSIEFHQSKKQQTFQLCSQYFKRRSRFSNRRIDILWIIADLHLPVNNVQTYFHEIHLNVF